MDQHRCPLQFALFIIIPASQIAGGRKGEPGRGSSQRVGTRVGVAHTGVWWLLRCFAKLWGYMVEIRLTLLRQRVPPALGSSREMQ